MGWLSYEGWLGERRMGEQVPKLRLSGSWLGAWGFAVGDDLQFTVACGRGCWSAAGARQARADAAPPCHLLPTEKAFVGLLHFRGDLCAAQSTT